MASAKGELEEPLMEAGNKLLQPPPSVDELLPLLDQVENFLSRVEQSPPKSMRNALSPVMKALVENELLRHSDVDVKVAVASCISEITRITAPDAPYDDDKMKDIFQLIVSSFENLSDESSRSYNKRTLILETVAKVRSCVVMLDLECDGLVVEMFQHFLKEIRDYHAEIIFSSMETIMTLVLEESEDISLELLSPLLASVKNDNEDFLPIAQKLGERVCENCAIKLKPYLTQAVKSFGFSLDDYSKVVASICEGTTSTVEHNVNSAPGAQLMASLCSTQNYLKYANKYCECGRKAIIKMTQNDVKKNKGRLYYSCEGKFCSFWQWCDPLGEGLVEQSASLINQQSTEHNINGMTEDLCNLKTEVRGITSTLQKLEMNQGIVKAVVTTSFVVACIACLLALVAIILK